MRKVTGLHLAGRDRVDGEDAGGDDGQQLGWGGNGRRVLEKSTNAGDLAIGNVDKKDVGEVGSGGELELVHDSVLHEEDEHDLHDAEAERGEQRGGGIARAVEICEAVAEGGRQVQAGAGEKESERGEDEEGGEEEDKQGADEAEGEPLTHLGGI